MLNGADDDGSGSVAVLEIAEALASGPERPKRSILFVWHTAEEMGLLGSKYFTRHPNVDMIGRGTATDPPRRRPSLPADDRLPPALQRAGRPHRSGQRRRGPRVPVRLPLRRRRAPGQLLLPQRSLHVRPVRDPHRVLHKRGSHLDYHQLTDEPPYIDYDKMARVAGLIGDVTRTVADLDHRLVVDKPKPDPEGVCKQ